MATRAAAIPSRDRWARRFTGGALALLVSLFIVVASPLAADTRVRAGVVRFARTTWSHALPRPPATARLELPFLRQEHALSCEVATLRMVLAYRGISVSESELLAKVGVDPTMRRRLNGALVWGDPDEAFVGDVDGIMGRTGYGVHAGPIGRIAGEYRKAEVIEGGTPAALADAIAHGNPVITWGYLGRGRPLRWGTPGGREVTAVDGEHTRVVVGYTGSVDAPTGFHVIDPVYGEQYWSRGRFLENWAPLGRIGVVVY